MNALQLIQYTITGKHHREKNLIKLTFYDMRNKHKGSWFTDGQNLKIPKLSHGGPSCRHESGTIPAN